MCLKGRNLKLRLFDKNIYRSYIIQISNRPFYVLVCDETTDESTKTQLSVSLRWVDECFGVHEDCLGLHELDSQDAEHITHAILGVLLRCNLNIEKCRGQAYNGVAANILRKSMNSLLMNYQFTKSSMLELIEEKGEPAVKAARWLNQMEKFKIYFGLKLGKFIPRGFRRYTQQTEILYQNLEIFRKFIYHCFIEQYYVRFSCRSSHFHRHRRSFMLITTC